MYLWVNKEQAFSSCWLQIDQYIRTYIRTVEPSSLQGTSLGQDTIVIIILVKIFKDNLSFVQRLDYLYAISGVTLYVRMYNHKFCTYVRTYVASAWV